MSKKRQQLEQQMMAFCHQFRPFDNRHTKLTPLNISGKQLDEIKVVLKEAGEVALQTDYQVETANFNKLMEQTERCLKAVKRQQMMLETTENINKVTDVIINNYGNEASRLLSAKRTYAQSKQKPTTDLFSLSSVKRDND